MSQSAGEIPTEQEAALAEQGKKKAKVNFPVFLGSSAGVLLVALWALISPDSAANVVGGWRSEPSQNGSAGSILVWLP